MLRFSRMFTVMSSILMLFLAFALMFVFTVARAQAQNLGGNAFSSDTRFYLTGGSGVQTQPGLQNATTSKVFLQTTDTASSTIMGYLNRADQIDLSLRGVGSSSSAVLSWSVDVSDNCIGNVVGNTTCDWYSLEEATSTTQNYQQVYPGQYPHSWTLTTAVVPLCGTNEVCKHIMIRGFIAKYFRIRFGITVANAGVWGYAATHEPIPN